MVGEVMLAVDARLASLAAGVESRLEVFPRVVELRSRFLLVAGGASVWPRFRRAVVAHPAAFRAVPQLAVLESLLAQAASAKERLLL